MKKLARLAFAYAALAFALPAASAAPIDDFVASRPLLDPAAIMRSAAEITSEAYPDADAVLVDDIVREAYRPDGTSMMLDDEYYKILTEKGRRQFISRQFGFNAAYGTCAVARAEIIKPDGRIVEVDLGRNCAVAIDTDQMGSNIYDPNDKVMSLLLPGLEIGDVSHILCLRETTKARVPDTWADYNVFESSEPVKAFTYEIISPAALPLRNVAVRDPIEGTITAEEEPLPDGGVLHRWTIRDVPQAFPEPDMPPLHTQVQRIISSTAEDWPTISRWYWSLCEPRLAAVTDEMRETVASLSEGAADEDEKIRRIFSWVSQNVRYMGITTEETAPGYEPHDVSVTFRNRYGVCRDKAALLTAMLRIAGVEAYPVLIHAGAKMDPDIPLPYFNHAITAVARPEGGYTLMDSTDESSRDLLPAYLANRSYLVARPEGETLAVSPVPPATDHLVVIKTDGQLDSRGTLSLRSKIDFQGVNDGVYRSFFSRSRPDQRRAFFEGIVKNCLPGAELTRFELLPADIRDTTRPLSAEIECRVRDWPVRGEGADTIALPILGPSLGYVNFLIGSTGLLKRRFPLVCEVACGVSENVSISVGDEFGKPVAMPDPLDIHEIGILLSRSVSSADGTLSISREFHVETPEFSPEQYLRLREILAEAERVARQKPVFAARASSGADVEVISSDTSFTVVSPSECTVEQSTATRVLTYAGIKRMSEQRWEYNPANAKFELVEASVENPDGSVHRISPEEINLMDAEWVSEAPRYPPSRVLVASLPGVQTGSVIRVTTRKSRTGLPVGATASFKGFDPLVRKSLALFVPEGMPEPRISHPSGGVEFTRSKRADGGTELKWVARDIPAMPYEDSCPPNYAFLPTLRFSYANLADYAKRVDAAFAEAAAAGSKNAEKRARELVAGIDDPSAKVRAIRDFVVRSIRAAGPDFTDIPLKFTPPDTTLADGYGHSPDRMLLLATMLRAAGFEARPVLVRPCTFAPWIAAAEDIPFAEAYSIALVEVRGRGRLFGGRPAIAAGFAPDDFFIIGDADQYAELGATNFDHSRLLGRDGAPSTIELPEEHRDFEYMESVIDIDEFGTASIAVTNYMSGMSCASYRKLFAELPPEERDRMHQELVGGISAAAVASSPLGFDPGEGIATMTLSVVASNFAARVGSTLSLSIPPGIERVANLRADTRELPLLCNGYIEKKGIVRVVLPAGAKSVVCMPDPLEITLPCGMGELSVTQEETMRADGRRELVFRQALARRPAIIPPEEYPALIEMNRRIAHPRMKTIVLTIGD